MSDLKGCAREMGISEALSDAVRDRIDRKRGRIASRFIDYEYVRDSPA